MGYPDLAAALRVRYPWVARLDIGPRSVVAGECDGCGAEARLVAPCGPPLPGVAHPDWGVGRRCAHRLGDDLWCDGHPDEAAWAIAWLDELPTEADDVARVWWLATGEIRFGPDSHAAIGRLALPDGLVDP